MVVIETPTLGRVSPNPKRTLTNEDAERIRNAKRLSDAAYSDYQVAVLVALDHGAGVRAVAEFTGLSTSTIQRWKKERP